MYGSTSKRLPCDDSRMSRIFALLLVVCLPLAARDPMQRVQLSTTSRIDFADGGTIRLTGSVGELNVEGWDRPEVQITLTRYTYADATEKAKREAERHLEPILFKTSRPANHELLIATSIPHREFVARMLFGRTGMNLDYRIMAPRNSHLIIRHGDGDVIVYNVGGDIDARMRNGGMVIEVPEQEKYSIDASCRIGGVTAPDEHGKSSKTYLVNEHFTTASEGAQHKLHLRVRAGGIDIIKTGAAPSVLKGM